LSESPLKFWPKYIEKIEQNILKMKNCILSGNRHDNFCFVQEIVPIKVESFIEEEGEIFILGIQFVELFRFYDEPSSSFDVGICEGIFEEDSILEKFPVSELSRKAVGIPP